MLKMEIETKTDPIMYEIELLPAEAEQGNEDDTERITIQPWSHQSTKILLSTYRQMISKIGKIPSLRTKKRMWELIRMKLENHGFFFTDLQVQNRWKTLERSYKKAQNNRNGEINYTVCPFQRELDAIMCDRMSISQDVIEVENGPSATPVSSPELKNNNCNDISQRDNNIVITEATKFREQQQRQHEIKMQFSEKKLQAYKERTETIKRRNELLEEIVEWLKK